MRVSEVANWYQTIILSNTVERPLFTDKSDFKSLDERMLFHQGKPVSDWDETFRLAVSKEEHEGDPDDVLANVLAIPVYSARLRGALEKAGITGIQYLPVQVFRLDGSAVPGYAIANVLNVAPCLDLERSDYFLFGSVNPERSNDILGLWKPVLCGNVLRGYDILRPKEYVRHLYVSERFKEVFEAGKFTGYSFTKLEIT